MREINHHILQEALQHLPLYEPKVSVWDNVDLELTADEHDANLQISVSSLPAYNPPASVWENIETGLDTEVEQDTEIQGTSGAPENARKLGYFKLRRWASIAAAVVALICGTWLFNDWYQSREIVSISYAEEKIPRGFLNVDWEEDEEAFAMVAEFCKSNAIVCKQPDFKIMTDELEELNSAREELKTVMESYGNDPDLIAQLTEIEHERTDLLKQIIKRI